MRFIGSLLLIICLNAASAQYWIGPKVGFHYTAHDYQEEAYESLYKFSKDLNFELGAVVTYTASDRYAVHGELYFERLGNRVRNKDSYFVDSKSNFNYLSAPMLMRVTMGHAPVHWYLNGGPKVSLWLGGRGDLAYSNDESANPDGIDRVNYKIVFKRRNAEGFDGGSYFVNEANRIQYSLTAGGGFYLDLANGARLMFDARYNWGHSNMGFNVNPQQTDGKTILVGNTTNIPTSGYQENYEYSHNTLSFSVAYMFEYNTDFKRKGSSTSSEAKKTKKSANKKKKG